MRLTRTVRIALLAMGTAFGPPFLGAPAVAAESVRVEPVQKELPVLFSADQLTYDQDAGVTRASGQVQMSHGPRILLADTVIYNEPANTVTASGNVALVEPSGEVVFADHADLTGDMKTGVIENIRAILSDGARLTASRARRTDGTRNAMRNASYTACNLCPDDPKRPPLWRVKAVKVVHDQTKNTITYSDAWMEIAGIPVAYTPYLSQPDPTVKRKTGLLAPTFGSSSDLGLLVQAPFFWAITPYEDVTITPWMTSNEGPLLEGEYRRALTHGRIDASGSITRDSLNNVRGHVFSRANYDINESWRAGLAINRASDRTYLRRYGFSKERTLTSRAFAENFWPHDYFAVNSYAFDDFDRDINQDTVPFVLPMVDYYGAGFADPLGGRTDMHLNLLSLTRDTGTDTRRLSARAQWALPMFGPIGDVWTFSTALWADGYNVTGEAVPGESDRFDGFAGRLFPQASLQWRLPLVRVGKNLTQTIEPMVEAIAAPHSGNSSKIPNEDSQDFEFDENNVFGFERFPGLDRVQEGPRFNYGLRWGASGLGAGYAGVFVGQSYRTRADKTFSSGSGVSDNFSDYVAAVDISPGDVLDVLYRTRLDHNDLSARRHELGAHIGVKTLALDTFYVLFDSPEESEFESRKEIDFSLFAQLTRYWRTRIFGIRDLGKGGGQRQLGIRFTYEDECLVFSTEYSRKNIDDRDLSPSNAVFFRIGFKTLGGVGTTFKP